MKVLEFGFGFPPRLVGFRKTLSGWKVILGHPRKQSNQLSDPKDSTPDESTIYSINLIPLGGFVRILGENNEHEDDPRSFINRPFWGRLFTLVAGVVMNVILAWILLSVGFLTGMPTAVDRLSDLPTNAKFTNQKLAIVEVLPKSPAEQSGLKAGDGIMAINGQKFASIEQIREFILQNSGQALNFQVNRNQQVLNIEVNSQKDFKAGEGPTGIALAHVGNLRFTLFTALWQGANTTFAQLSNIFVGLYGLISAKIGLGALGGPVKIAQITGQVADMGFIYLIQFTAFLSLNLAVLNILPFPALDGGRVFFLLIEKLRGKRNNQKIEQVFNTFGFAFLILLMILVTIKDVKGF
jgi:regulator of sigma E protease